MLTKKPWIFLLFIILLSCSKEQESFRSIEIAARNDEYSIEKPVIYRMKIPSHWQQVLPSDESLVDTKKTIIEFFIEEQGEKIRITLHNFPSDRLEQRIPPMAQIGRWKKQFSDLRPSDINIQSQAFAGYSGQLFEATGEMQDKKITVLGWVLLLAPEHFLALSRPVPEVIARRHRQMRGDVTIKAVGPEELMNKHRKEIISSARTFQLIDDIP